MSATRIKAVIAALLMLASAMAAHYWRPTEFMADKRPKLDLESVFPKQFGDWKLDEHQPVQLISPVTRALLNKIYNQTLSRTYVDGQGQRIMLSVAYGGDQSEGTRAHRPEVCYPAQGFEVLSSEIGELATAEHSVRVKRLVAKLDTRVEPITYWVVVGDHVALSGTEQKIEQMRYSLRGIVPDGMLVRVSSIEPDKSKAYALQGNFVAQLAGALNPGYRSRVLGSTGA